MGMPTIQISSKDCLVHEGYNYHAYLHKLAKYTNCFGLPKAYIQIQKIPKPENTKKIDIHRVMTVPRQPNKTI
jgi:hypothetical protein